MSVDLPEPDGPMMAVKRSAANSTVTPSRARTSASPRPYNFTASTAAAAGGANAVGVGAGAGNGRAAWWAGRGVVEWVGRSVAVLVMSPMVRRPAPVVVGRSALLAPPCAVHLRMYTLMVSGRMRIGGRCRTVTL